VVSSIVTTAGAKRLSVAKLRICHCCLEFIKSLIE
jgi:hypothetical protein